MWPLLGVVSGESAVDAMEVWSEPSFRQPEIGGKAKALG
jgi:hypothetical protein